ncbi:MAG: hypothetical protein DMG29_14885 [Acidobacteria bacterium]|nr:MAG: hypothetical protein DMG29_14885 [Acidobacteriota bacterium]
MIDVFSTAVWLARFCSLRRRESLEHLGVQPPVGQLVDVLQLLIDGFRQRKWIQRLPQALQLGHTGHMSLRQGGHALQRGLGRGSMARYVPLCRPTEGGRLCRPELYLPRRGM